MGEASRAQRGGWGHPNPVRPFDLPATITTGTTPGRLTQFDYTADQQRVVRRDPDRTRHFVGDFYERVLSPSGATQEEHFRLSAGGMVAEIIRTPAGDQTLYFHPDALGTPETLTDAAGNVTHQAFDPFGTRRDGPGGPATRIGYTGHHQDDDLGLIDMGGRVYDPLAGRFTTADPFMQAPYWSQGQNRYAYVFNDPINLTDPSGFSADGAGVAGGAFMGEILLGGLASVGLRAAPVSGLGAAGGLGGGAANVVGTLAGNPFQGSSGGSFSAAAPSGTPNTSPVKPGGTNAVGQGSPPAAMQALPSAAEARAELGFADERTACVGAAMRWCQMGMEAAKRYGPRAAQAARQMATSQWWRTEWQKGVQFWTHHGQRIWSLLGNTQSITSRFDPARANHIFRNAPGHVSTTDAASRAQWMNIFEQVGSNPAFHRPDAVNARIITQQAANAGVQAYTWTASTGHQVWVTVRAGFIQNAGANLPGAYR